MHGREIQSLFDLIKFSEPELSKFWEELNQNDKSVVGAHIGYNIQDGPEIFCAMLNLVLILTAIYQK